MNQTIGLLLVLIAGIFQGTFILPMTLVKKWKWENIWFVFSVFGMVILNLLLAFIFIQKLHLVYRDVAFNDLFVLGIFGIAWGIGAVLFGIGMDKLGMALGYPIIMGLIASAGSLLPLFILHPQDIVKPSGLMLIAGVIVAIVGIIICSKAANLRTSGSSGKTKNKKLTGGIIIAVSAGLLSSLPNIGFSFGSSIAEAAIENGTPDAVAGNAVWALFFTAGFIPNMLYTVFLMLRNGTFKLIISEISVQNIGLGLLMAVFWIGSFYIYGISSYSLGILGSVVGWPLFISISIVVGNIWGIWRGEWRDSPAKARKLLNVGMIILIAAMIIFGISNIL